MQLQSSNSPDLRDYLRPLRSWWWLVLLITVLATGLTYVYDSTKPKTYIATTTLFLEPTNADAAAALRDPDRNARNDAVLLRTGVVAREVAHDIGFTGDPRSLLDSITATPSKDTDFLEIGARGVDPKLTAALANAFARAYTRITQSRARLRATRARKDAERQLKSIPAIEDTKTTRSELMTRVQDLRGAESAFQSSPRQREPALVPTSAIGPNPGRNALFALVLSGVLAALIAYGLELLDRRVNRLEEVHARYARSVLVAIPRAPSNTINKSAHELELVDCLVEPFRSLRTTLQMQATDAVDETEILPPNTILVTSAVIGEGKSMVARNLALAYVEAGMSVALVDADLRRPSLASEFGLAVEPGLADVLAERRSVEAVMRVLRTSQNGAGPAHSTGSRFGLTVLTSGRTTGDPAALLSGTKLLRVIGLLRASHAIVIIDSPPLLAVSDALSLLPVVDGVLLVSRLGVTPISAVEKLNDLLERVRDVNILGVVANDVQESTGYGYTDL